MAAFRHVNANSGGGGGGGLGRDVATTFTKIIACKTRTVAGKTTVDDKSSSVGRRARGRTRTHDNIVVIIITIIIIRTRVSIQSARSAAATVVKLPSSLKSN